MTPRSSSRVVLDEARGPRGGADVQDQLLRWSPDHHLERCALEDGSEVLLALPRPRVHVTFLIEKCTFEYGRSGISISLDNLVATLDESGLATWNVVHYDSNFGMHRRDMEIAQPEFGGDLERYARETILRGRKSGTMLTQMRDVTAAEAAAAPVLSGRR